MNSFNEYQTAAMSTRTSRTLPFIYPALGLTGEAGEVAENVKKMIRDDDYLLTAERKDKLKKELGDVMWYIAALAQDCDLDLDDIAQANIAKLHDRKTRGVLHGSGDNR